MNISVANLSPETNEDQLRYAFSAFGQVRAVRIVKDATSGEAKGLISMPVEKEAKTAVSRMSGQNLQGRIIQAVIQPGTNILPINDRSGVSRLAHGGPRGGPHGGPRGGTRGGPRGHARGGPRGGAKGGGYGRPRRGRRRRA